MEPRFISGQERPHLPITSYRSHNYLLEDACTSFSGMLSYAE
jgi:hypothetical protein